MIHDISMSSHNKIHINRDLWEYFLRIGETIFYEIKIHLHDSILKSFNSGYYTITIIKYLSVKRYLKFQKLNKMMK